MTAGIDVITVSDFTGPNARVQSWRTLFLLASWHRLRLHQKPHTFHLVCIGDPPTAVIHMADQCQCRLHRSSPFEGNLTRTDNKIRGLEITGEHETFLLIDNDLLFLREDPALLTPRKSLAATVGALPRVPPQHWSVFYSACNVAEPRERITCAHEQLRLPKRGELFPGQWETMKGMHPYFNSSVVRSPWDSGLRELWPFFQRKLSASSFDQSDTSFRYLNKTDQVSFSLAIQKLRAENHPFEVLPRTVNVSDTMLFFGGISWEKVSCLHVSPFGFKELQCASSVQAARRLCLRRSWLRAVGALWAAMTASLYPRRLPPPALFSKSWRWARFRDGLLTRFIQPLCGTQIFPK